MEVTIADKALGVITVHDAVRHENGAVTMMFHSESGDLLAIVFPQVGNLVVFDPKFPKLKYRNADFEQPLRALLRMGGF